jgi:hypothetical protein
MTSRTPEYAITRRNMEKPGRQNTGSVTLVNSLAHEKLKLSINQKLCVFLFAFE